jgi:hypothetical protein
MVTICVDEHATAPGADLRCSPAVDVGRGVVPDAGMTMVLVVPAEEATAEGAGVLQRAEAVGELGPVLEGLELRLRVGVVVGAVRPGVLLVTPRSASIRATGLELIEGPRSAWMVSWSSSTLCLPMLSASSRSANTAVSRVASIQPTT